MITYTEKAMLVSVISLLILGILLFPPTDSGFTFFLFAGRDSIDVVKLVYEEAMILLFGGVAYLTMSMKHRMRRYKRHEHRKLEGRKREKGLPSV